MKRALPILPLLLLCALAAWSVIGQLSFLRDPTSPEEWRGAAQHARALLDDAPEARILVFPVWRETPLPELVPVSHALLWNDTPLLEDLQHTSHLIVITPTARRDDAMAALPFSASPEREEHFGAVTTFRLPLPADTQWPLELADALPRAKVTLLGPEGKNTPCSRWQEREPDRGWRCAHPNAAPVVGVIEGELLDAPRRCILAMPPSDATHTLQLTFPELDLPADHQLRIRAGFTLRGARIQNEPPHPATLRVKRGDALLVERTYASDVTGWDAIDIPLNDKAEMGHITLEVSSPSGNLDKPFCLNGWLLPR